MPYIGRSEKMGVRTVFHYLASNGTTSISGADVDGKTLTFADGNYIDVYLNGVRLKKGEDFNTTTANTVAGLAALNANDEVNIVVYDAFSIADVVPASSGGSFGGNISLTSDNAVLSFGVDSDIKITHDPDDGLFLKSTATADDNPFVLTLQTGETDIAQSDVLGTINFQAPDEGTGTDAILVAAGIRAVSEGDFSSSSNATSLEFMTAASEAAATKMSVTSGGDVNVLTDGASIFFGADSEIELRHVADDGLILKHVGTADGKEPSLTFQAGDNDIAQSDLLGSIQFQAPDEGAGTDAILVAAGISAESEGDFSSSSNATSLKFTTASSAAAAIGGTDGGEMTLLSNGALLLRDKRTTGAPTLALQAGRTDVSQGDVLGGIEFSAPVEASGTDAILVGASINAAADADYSSSSNATSLLFKTGSSETAATKMTLTSAGSLGIGVTSPDSTLHLASASGHHYIERFLAGDAAGPGITFRKSRASSQGGFTAVAQSDVLGQIYFQGADGDSFASAAYIRAQVDSAVGDGDVRATLQFATGTSGGLGSALEINSDKLNRMYLTNSDNNYVVNANAVGSAGSAGLHNLYFKADSAVFTGYHYYAKKEPTILYVDGDTIPSGKKIGDVKTQGETFEMGDVIVYENGKVTKCTEANATNVVGIYSGHPMPGGRWLSNNKDDIATEEHALEVASVGDSQDWNKTVTHYLTGFKVCDENGAISSGDLLCSAGKDGYLMKQDGTTITTATVGKSMDTVKFESDGTATGIYGFLYCG